MLDRFFSLEPCLGLQAKEWQRIRATDQSGESGKAEARVLNKTKECRPRSPHRPAPYQGMIGRKLTEGPY